MAYFLLKISQGTHRLETCDRDAFGSQSVGTSYERGWPLVGIFEVSEDVFSKNNEAVV
jgi:hypothetical protein